MAADVGLPPGFELDPVAPLPPGFELDPATAPAAASKPSPMRETAIRLLRSLVQGGPMGLVAAGGREGMHGLDTVGEMAGDAIVENVPKLSGKRSVLNPLALEIPAEATAAAATVAKLAPGVLVGGVGGGVAGKPAMEAGAKSVMKSALKPSSASQVGGIHSDAAKAIQTMLDEGVNVSTGGALKMRELIQKLHGDVAKRIAQSTEVVDKGNAMLQVNKVLKKFTTQVNNRADRQAVLKAWKEFNDDVADILPIQKAQELKQGTYKVLADKYAKGGQPAIENEASTQAQMAVARGLRQSIEERIPEVAKLNKRESDLINALELAEKRAGIAGNRDIAGIAWLAQNPAAAAAMFADRSPLFKSILARMMYEGRTAVPAGAGAAAGAAAVEEGRP